MSEREVPQSDRRQGSGPLSSTPVIFVADDDASFRAAMIRLLRASGYEVEAFDSAEAFLSRGRASKLGCLVLDLDMPGQNGLQLQETLARAGDNLPLVFVTGHGDVPQSVRAMKGGAVDFLTKPVARRDLVAAIERALAQAAQREAQRIERGRLQARFHRLSPRERQVFERVVTGLLNKQIAFELGIGLRTIKVYRARVMDKMEADSLTHLVRMADGLGLPVSLAAPPGRERHLRPSASR